VETLPENVRRFIEAYIDEVPQLETLLMMSEAQDSAWVANEVAARNYITVPRAREILDALRRRGLLSSDETHFRYEPAVATFIHSKPSASIKEFARAFEFKKDR
jgi:DNA-binding IclR family transcriptional regulator